MRSPLLTRHSAQPDRKPARLPPRLEEPVDRILFPNGGYKYYYNTAVPVVLRVLMLLLSILLQLLLYYFYYNYFYHSCTTYITAEFSVIINTAS